MKNSTCALLVLAVGLGGFCANAGTIAAIDSVNGTAYDWRSVIGANQSATVGWSFVVGAQNLELSALGLFDGCGDGLQTSHAVGIWSSGGSTLAQATVAPGTGRALLGGYRYESVAPLTLAAGQTYFVGAYFAPVADRCGSACGDSILAFGSETFAPGLTFLHSTQTRSTIGNGPLSFPGLEAGVDQGFFGPNFLLTTVDPVATPEPGSLGLVGLGLMVTIVGAFRRNAGAIRRPLAS